VDFLGERARLEVFEPIALERPGMVSRLFRRRIKENAYREIENLLAAKPAADIPDKAILRAVSGRAAL
jgi:hypothetical protein